MNTQHEAIDEQHQTFDQKIMQTTPSKLRQRTSNEKQPGALLYLYLSPVASALTELHRKKARE